jgi:hypothetical protein
MPPLSFTSYDNCVFVNLKQIERLSLTPREHLLKCSTLPLKNRLIVSKRLRHAIEIERDARNHEFFAPAPVLVLCYNGSKNDQV